MPCFFHQCFAQDGHGGDGGGGPLRGWADLAPDRGAGAAPACRCWCCPTRSGFGGACARGWSRVRGRGCKGRQAGGLRGPPLGRGRPGLGYRRRRGWRHCGRRLHRAGAARVGDGSGGSGRRALPGASRAARERWVKGGALFWGKGRRLLVGVCLHLFCGRACWGCGRGADPSGDAGVSRRRQPRGARLYQPRGVGGKGKTATRGGCCGPPRPLPWVSAHLAPAAARHPSRGPRRHAATVRGLRVAATPHPPPAEAGRPTHHRRHPRLALSPHVGLALGPSISSLSLPHLVPPPLPLFQTEEAPFVPLLC